MSLAKRLKIAESVKFYSSLSLDANAYPKRVYCSNTSFSRLRYPKN
jgi:hypothetical protein